MKRSNYYICTCLIAMFISLIGLILSNSGVSIKDLVTFNFVLNMPRFKEILTYILSVSLVFSIAFLIFSIGFKKKKNEEIAQIKKYAFFELLFVLKKQKNQLEEYPPIEDPVSIYVNYMLIANELQAACKKTLDLYENLLTTWERESLKTLQTSTIALLSNATIGGNNFEEYSIKSFCSYYDEKVKSSPQSENFNSFKHLLKTDIEKYSKIIENTYEDFKNYY